jgi:uncharacterized protein YbbK (DUF523 family)
MAIILVSACLIGCSCRYDGKSCECAELKKLLENNTFIPVCPEQMGGLPTPRLPSERQGEIVIMKDGTDVTLQYQKGAEIALHIALTCRADFAILKSKSPSCGKGYIYDGSFSGNLIEGNGITVEKLISNGIPVYSEKEIGQLHD